MSQDNQITLRGYLTAEPKFYQKDLNMVPYTMLRVGSTPRRLNRDTGEWEDMPSVYYKVKCFRRLAVNASASFRKGDLVFVRGTLRLENWVDSEGKIRTSVEVDADVVGHDLEYGWAHFTRSYRGAENRLGAGEMARQDLGGDELPPPPNYPPDFAQQEYAQREYAEPAADGQSDAQESAFGSATSAESDTGDGIGPLTGEIGALEREAVPF